MKTKIQYCLILCTLLLSATVILLSVSTETAIAESTDATPLKTPNPVENIQTATYETANKKLKIIRKFNTVDEMKVFLSLMQTKQSILNRAAVLEDYVAVERANLNNINGQLLLKFKIDPSKNYSLDTNKKSLVEIENSAGDTQTGIGRNQPTQPAEKIIRNFSDENELKVFISMIQSQQLVLNRIAVLQNYLLLEKSNLDTLNGQLLLNYRIEPDKNYSLDQNQLLILEDDK